MINNKYEIIFNLQINNEILISLKIYNNTYYGKKINLKNIFYFTYIIKIIGYHIIIEDEKHELISKNIDDNNFNSIKIKSQINAETIWDYEESLNKDIKLYDTIFI